MNYFKTSFGRRVATFCLSIAAVSGSSIAGAQSLEESLRAALDGDLATVQRIVERGATPDTADQDGNSLLMLAARNGQVPVVTYLLSRKASVNARNRYGDTALMAAALKGHVEVAKMLVGNGAEVNSPGWAPLH